MTRCGGTVAACGLAQGMDLPTTVAPFILRGVPLAGIEPVFAPRLRRVGAWQGSRGISTDALLRAHPVGVARPSRYELSGSKPIGFCL